MIVVYVDLHDANFGRIKRLAVALVDNVSTPGDGEQADYRVRVREDAASIGEVIVNPDKEGLLKKYPRNTNPVWRLVSEALGCVYPERN